MAHDILAPWAEAAPDADHKTVDDLLVLSAQVRDDQWTYELVEGRLVRMPSSGGEASVIALQLSMALMQFVRPGNLGKVTGADGTFDLTQSGDPEETALVPDVAFVRAAHVPLRDTPEYSRAWKLAPDLVAEVASPNQYRPEMAAKAQAKAQRYLAAGVQLVWTIWPKSRQVDVWRPGADAPVMTLKDGDNLDGMDVLPGFTYALADLFA